MRTARVNKSQTRPIRSIYHLGIGISEEAYGEKTQRNVGGVVAGVVDDDGERKDRNTTQIQEATSRIALSLPDTNHIQTFKSFKDEKEH